MVQVLAGRTGHFLIAGVAFSLCVANMGKAQAPAGNPKTPAVGPYSAHAKESDEEHAAHSAPFDPKTESNLDYFWRKSDEAFHKGDYERAIQLHRAIVALDPTDVESYSVGAWLLWSLGKKDDAVAFIQRGTKANPDNWDMWDEAGQHYDLQKMVPESLNAYRQAVAHFPAEAPANESQMLRRRLAHSAEHAGEWQLSAQTWRDLVRDFPDEAVNKNNLARVEALTKQKATQAKVQLPYLPVLASCTIFAFGSLVVAQRKNTL